jgi:hypothetical protein
MGMGPAQPSLLNMLAMLMNWATTITAALSILHQ